jgi:hypothetical protein
MTRLSQLNNENSSYYQTLNNWDNSTVDSYFNYDNNRYDNCKNCKKTVKKINLLKQNISDYNKLREILLE